MTNKTIETSQNILKSARGFLRIEQDGLRALEAQLDEHFVAAVEWLLACRGKVVVTGMGKSGHIGRKLSATLS
ncbi:MAG: D-arabinose 5-phosphate isomerase, partial [SAR324 cluster bacterium]|nr:D-arabinose 5-phosphate isomerase [SAR324 cluster bacterium]